MDYSKFPPEVNARRIAGPGVQSLQDAADAWQNLRRELDMAAWLMSGVLEELSERWEGEAAILMTAAARRYKDWLEDVSDLVHQTALQLKYLAGKHSAGTYSVTVERMYPLRQIEANRNAKTVLASDPAAALLHAPEIAKLDAEYEVFWETNAQAMNNYASYVRERLGRLIPWPLAPYISKEAGLNLKGLPRYPRGDPSRFAQPVNYHA